MTLDDLEKTCAAMCRNHSRDGSLEQMVAEETLKLLAVARAAKAARDFEDSLDSTADIDWPEEHDRLLIAVNEALAALEASP